MSLVGGMSLVCDSNRDSTWFASRLARSSASACLRACWIDQKTPTTSTIAGRSINCQRLS